jgi:hypothetical protein
MFEIGNNIKIQIIMKHLKNWKIFEEIDIQMYDDIKDYLKEIFLDLEDQSYSVEIEKRGIRTKAGWEKISAYRIEISKLKKVNRVQVGESPDGVFLGEEVLPVIEHAISYLADFEFNQLQFFYKETEFSLYGHSNRTIESWSYSDIKKLIKQKEKSITSLEIYIRKKSTDWNY